MSDDSLSRPAPRPQCGRCFRPVDSASSTPIYQKDKLIGYRLAYACHGEVWTSEKQGDIQASWFEEPGNDIKPFLDVVFKPEVMKAVKPEDVLRDKIVGENRDRHVRMQDFINATVTEVIKSQKTYKSNPAEWAVNNSLRLESAYWEGGVNFHLWRLTVNTKTVLGHFELPLYPDQEDWKWIPTVKNPK